MKFKYLIIIAIAMLVSILILEIEKVNGESELKTDLKIITRLPNGSYITPALTENRTFVYCNFEFNLYSNKNNTGYTIIVDNITIANKTILNFKDLFYWNTSKDYINLLEVFISKDYYSFSNIFIFSHSISNRTIVKDDEDLITFTKEEFEDYISKLEMRMFTSNAFAWILAGFSAYYYVKKYKEYKIETIA